MGDDSDVLLGDLSHPLLSRSDSGSDISPFGELDHSLPPLPTQGMLPLRVGLARKESMTDLFPSLPPHTLRENPLPPSRYSTEQSRRNAIRGRKGGRTARKERKNGRGRKGVLPRSESFPFLGQLELSALEMDALGSLSATYEASRTTCVLSRDRTRAVAALGTMPLLDLVEYNENQEVGASRAPHQPSVSPQPGLLIPLSPDDEPASDGRKRKRSCDALEGGEGGEAEGGGEKRQKVLSKKKKSVRRVVVRRRARRRCTTDVGAPTETGEEEEEETLERKEEREEELKRVYQASAQITLVPFAKARVDAYGMAPNFVPTPYMHKVVMGDASLTRLFLRIHHWPSEFEKYAGRIIIIQLPPKQSSKAFRDAWQVRPPSERWKQPSSRRLHRGKKDKTALSKSTPAADSPMYVQYRVRADEAYAYRCYIPGQFCHRSPHAPILQFMHVVRRDQDDA